MWFVIVLIVLILCWPWIWRYIRGWLARMAARRAEDMIRRMTGMPPRDEEKKQQRERQKQRRSSAYAADEYEEGHGRSGRRRANPRYSIAALMQRVAVDVSFVEIKEFSSTVIADDGAAYSYRREEQITDVKFVEIKDRR